MQNPFATVLPGNASIPDRLRAELPGLSSALQRLEASVSKHGGTLYLVGGFVRDARRGILSRDIDAEVYGIEAKALEEILQEIFPDNVHLVGKAFGIFHIVAGDGSLDVALPRRESKQGNGHRGFVVEGDPYMSIEEATRRRDFTVNAMLFRLPTWELIDPFNGQADLDAGILRVVDPATFQDDPLRVYRAVQFAARLDLSLEEETRQLLRTMVERGDLAELSKERITDEIRKLMLKSERPSIGFTLLRELGIIERDYSELSILIGTEQEHEWHPEGDVWIHTLMVVDAAAALLRRTQDGLSEQEEVSVMLGALCHDLGKPATTEVLEGRVRSRGHEEAGIEPTAALLSKWTFGQDVGYAAEVAAAEHLKPGMLWNDREKGRLSPSQYENAVRRLVMRIAPVSWQVLIAVSEADWRGRALEGVATVPYEHGIAFRSAVAALEAREELQPLLRGNDLLALGFEPGPKIGELIKRVEAARDQGKISTRNEAIDWINTQRE